MIREKGKTVPKSNKPIVLVILDGFGYRATSTFNAIAQAETPHFDAWFAQYPHAILQAAGSAVGLLQGFIGNSEVGHLTIGSGRIVPQPVLLIHEVIQTSALSKNKKLIARMKKLAQTGHNMHIIGLLSDAGVHSHEELLHALIKSALKQHVPHIYVHPILDGRDVPPQSAQRYLTRLEDALKEQPNVTIGSIHGRFYAMDRDHNWDRTEKSYTCLTQQQPARFSHWKQLLDYWYTQDISDEFIYPTQLTQNSTIQPGDGIVFFNFRPDRARQLTKLLLSNKKKLGFSFFITPFSYDPELKTTALFEKEPITNTLMDVFYQQHKTTFAIAETEKYAHVTYFFNAGREDAYQTETQILIPSIKTKNYALTPEMSASKITQAVLQSLQKDPKEFYLINYANADMVGHTGNLQATIKAIEYLDQQCTLLYEQVVNKMDGTLIITADHGNAEDMFDVTTNQPKTAHTNNPVPFIVINKELKGSKKQLPLKTLADIAPYMLTLLKIPIPKEMKNM